MNDPLQDYMDRPTTLRRPGRSDYLENLLDNVADVSIPDEKLMSYLFGFLRSVEIRIEPYADAPVKGIISLPLEHEALDDIRLDLAKALTPMLRAAVKEACLKHLVDQHPG